MRFIPIEDVAKATHYAFFRSGNEDGVSLRLADGRGITVWQDGTAHESKSDLDRPEYAADLGCLEHARSVCVGYLAPEEVDAEEAATLFEEMFLWWAVVGSSWQNGQFDAVLNEEIEAFQRAGREVVKVRVRHPDQWEDVYLVSRTTTT